MESTTNLSAWGTSRAVRIPKKMCEEAGMDIGSVVTLTLLQDEQGAYIVLRPQGDGHRNCGGAPYESIDEIFAGYSGEYEPAEIDWGDDVGAERLT